MGPGGLLPEALVCLSPHSSDPHVLRLKLSLMFFSCFFSLVPPSWYFLIHLLKILFQSLKSVPIIFVCVLWYSQVCISEDIYPGVKLLSYVYLVLLGTATNWLYQFNFSGALNECSSFFTSSTTRYHQSF